MNVETDSRRCSSSARDFSYWAVAAIFAAPACGGFQFGYDIGATSYALVQLRNWSGLVHDSSILQGLLLSGASFGALVGSSLVFWNDDRMGRRRELQAAALLYMLGAIMETAAIMFAKGLAICLLLAGRLVYGIGMGVALHAAPTYLSEMCPTRLRGLVLSSKEASIVFGILMGNLIGYGFSGSSHGWSRTYACGIFVSLTMLLCSLVIPRSCRWLLKHGLDDEALDSLRFVYGSVEIAQATFQEMKERHQAYESAFNEGQTERTQKTVWSPSSRRPLIAGVGLVILQQITGQPSVLSYAAPILQNAGLSDFASVLIAAFKLVATLTTAFTVERVGRKKPLYAGCALMFFALTTLAAVYGSDISSTKKVVLAAMFVYIGGYQVGFGPITWLIIGEVFPLSVRGQAVALAVQVNFFVNTIVQFGVPVLEKWIGLNLTFAFFAVLTGYSLHFVAVNVPETKGLSLEEIEEQLAEIERTRASSQQSEVTPLLEEDQADP